MQIHGRENRLMFLQEGREAKERTGKQRIMASQDITEALLCYLADKCHKGKAKGRSCLWPIKPPRRSIISDNYRINCSPFSAPC